MKEPLKYGESRCESLQALRAWRCPRPQRGPERISSEGCANSQTRALAAFGLVTSRPAPNVRALQSTGLGVEWGRRVLAIAGAARFWGWGGGGVVFVSTRDTACRIAPPIYPRDLLFHFYCYILSFLSDCNLLTGSAFAIPPGDCFLGPSFF